MLHKFSCFLLSSPARLPCVLYHAAQVDISEQNTCCTGYMQMASLLYVFVHDSEDVSSVQNACYTGCMKTLFHLHVSLSYEHAGTALSIPLATLVTGKRLLPRMYLFMVVKNSWLPEGLATLFTFERPVCWMCSFMCVKSPGITKIFITGSALERPRSCMCSFMVL